jgi:hypothetical protein
VSDLNLAEAVTQATEDVLSTMFFTMVDEAPADIEDAPGTEAVISFRGHWAGTLALWSSSNATAEMTANFLGLDGDEPPSEAEQHAVLVELANMICGAVLSKIGGGELFELLPSEQSAPAAGVGDPGGTIIDGVHGFCIQQSLGVGLGCIRLKFQMDDVP